MDLDQGRVRGWMFIGVFAFLVIARCGTPANAQYDTASPDLDLGIIVVPTVDDAHIVEKQLRSGENFSVLAKEKSVDATATDGGYLGKLNPDSLSLFRP